MALCKIHPLLSNLYFLLANSNRLQYCWLIARAVRTRSRQYRLLKPWGKEKGTLQKPLQPQRRGGLKKPLKSEPARAFIRQFRHPDSVNLSAQEYPDFLDWSKSRTWHEPPVTEGCSDEVLKAHINDWNALILPRIPGNAQEVERHIKVMTEVSKVKKTHEGRHSRIIKLPKI